MKYEQYEFVKTSIENNRWGDAIAEVDVLLGKYKRDKFLKEFKTQLHLWHELGAQVRTIKDVAKDMVISDYFYHPESDDGNKLVLYIPGDLNYPSDLDLDIYETDKVPWLEGNYSIFVKGDVNVNGSIVNFCPNTGVALCVAGGITADYLIGGGSVIAASELSNVKYAVIGFYNDGSIQLGKLNTKLFWSEDHLMFFTGGDNTPHWVSDDPQEILEILRPQIKDEILESIRDDFEDDDEEGFDEHDALLSVSLFDEYVGDYLFGDDRKSFDYVFSELF